MSELMNDERTWWLRSAPAGACLLLIVALGAPACSSPESPGGGGWESETVTEGDVTTVRTLAGSVWGAPALLEESLSIGVDRGEDPYMFGRVAGVASRDGQIYVLDSDVPALRVYDGDGRYLRDIGAVGDGPGEFRQPDAMLLAPDGRVFVRSMNQGRITVFDADGAVVETRPLDGGFVVVGPGMGMVMTADGKVYSPGPVGGMGSPGSGMRRMQLGMVPRGVDGTDGEALPRPEFDYEPLRFVRERRSGGNVMRMAMAVPQSPQVVATLAESGAWVAGVGNDYSFDIIEPSGRTTRVVKDWEPQELAAAERDWYIEQTTARMRDGNPEWVWEGPEMPTVKPAFNQLFPDSSGRIWVGRPGAGIEDPECEKDPENGLWDPPCWSDERSLEVFDTEGRFLGTVETPAGFRLSDSASIRGTQIITPVEDDMGVITIKRYQLVVPD